MVSCFIFCHPDDEFAVFPLIESEMYEKKNQVICCYLTDGAFGQQDPIIRMEESKTVLNRMGLSLSDIFFIGFSLNIPDCGLVYHLKPIYDAVRQMLSEYNNIESLYIPAWEGGHQDHDAAHVIGTVLASELGILDRTLQFSLYHGEGLIGPLFKVMTPLMSNGKIHFKKIHIKKRLTYILKCLQYKSQWKTWVGLFLFVMFHYLVIGKIYIQPVHTIRLMSSPHRGKLLYERRGFFSWDIFKKELANFINYQKGQ